jgi:hypothetical protein
MNRISHKIGSPARSFKRVIYRSLRKESSWAMEGEGTCERPELIADNAVPEEKDLLIFELPA